MKDYYIKASLMFLFGNPIAMFSAMIAVVMFSPLLLVFTSLLTLIMYKFWMFALRVTLPPKASQVFLPLFIMYCFQICAAIIDVREPRFIFAYFLYLIPVGLLFFMRDEMIFLIMPIVINAMTVLTVLVIMFIFDRTKKIMIFDKIVVIYILVFIGLASLSSHVSYTALSNRYKPQIINIFSPTQSYLLSEHGHTFISILETDNKLELWSPIATFPWRRDKIQPDFSIYTITNLSEEFLPAQSGEFRTNLFISESVLSSLKDPTVAGSYQNQAYSLYIYDREEKLTNVSRTLRSYSNRPIDSTSNRIRATIINKINGLCYLDESFQLPQQFNSQELFNVGIFPGFFEGLEEDGAVIQNIIEIDHYNFKYAYIFSYDVSEIDDVEIYGFIGFNKLETKIPYYPWAVYDTFDDIQTSRQYYNYRFFLIYPSYDFFGGDVGSSLSLLYNVDKQAIEEMIHSIAEVEME